MRYLVAVDTWFPDSPEGMARVAWDHARLMAESGHTVMLLHLGEGSKSYETHGVRVVGLGVLGRARGERVVWSYLSGHLKRLVAACIGDGSFDVVHLYSPMLGAVVASCLHGADRIVYTLCSPVALEQRANWGRSSPVSVVFRSAKARVLNLVERRVLQRSDAVHVHSEFSAAWVRRLHRVEPVVIPHWTSLPGSSLSDVESARKRLGWSASQPVVFTVRGHKPRVGLEDLIRAAAPAAREGRCQVVIGGSGPLTSQLRALTASLEVESGISFPGRLSEEQLRDAYLGADLFVLPTRELECFGLVTLEALSYGCPVLGSDAGATPELLGPILPEFLFAAGDVMMLRSKLDSFLGGRLRAPAPEELREYVEERYGRRRVGDALIRFISGGGAM